MNDMIKIIKSNEHYHNEEEDWFSTYWHFSFAHYQDPHKMNFGPLRVFNDDVIQPATGFDFHPHRDMEIITYVSEGKLEHRYNQGNHDVIHPGDEVQRMMMTAGSGILHSQYNRSKDKSLRLLQMWIFPSKRELEPSWEQRQFEKQGRANKLLPVVMPENAKPNGPASKEIEYAAEAVAWADAFILASPDYHGSMSGALKNFLDHFFEEFAGKVFGYIVASHEKGLTVMDQMRTAVRQCYGWSMPYGVSISGEQDFATGGEISNISLSKRLQMMSRDLVVYGRLVRDQFVRDLGSSEQHTFAAHYRP